MPDAAPSPEGAAAGVPSGSRWLAGRRPAPPEALVEWVAPYLEERAGSPAGLADAGRSALFRSLDEPEGERSAAFHLLAADALLTYACEAAADVPDCQGELEELVRATASVGDGDGEEG